MPIVKLINEPNQAYRNIALRLQGDMKPLWQSIRTDDSYTPYWLIARELFPVAESVGALIHNDISNTKNLIDFFEKDLQKVRPGYADVSHIASDIYRHSLIHQDEMRSLRAGAITIEWRLSIGDSEYHLKRKHKNPRKRACTLSFDLFIFYNDILELLKMYEKKGPKRGIVGRYNRWTLKISPNSDTRLQAHEFYYS